jgi:signal transduction histidine kinase
MTNSISNHAASIAHVQDPLPEPRLRETQRLELAATIAAGHVHELNNLLTAVIANLSMAQLTAVEGSESAGYVSESMTAANRAAQVVSRLQDLARPHALAQTRIFVPELLAQASALFRPLVPRNVTFDVESSDEGYLEGDFALLQQSLLNLFLNARDALPGGGRITLSASENAPGTPKANHVLSVHDTGDGIPARILARVFDPFFTTKADGAGSGLGLFAVAEIAEAHHGEARVQSEPGHGTTVSMVLPALQPHADRKPRKPH